MPLADRLPRLSPGRYRPPQRGIAISRPAGSSNSESRWYSCHACLFYFILFRNLAAQSVQDCTSNISDHIQTTHRGVSRPRDAVVVHLFAIMRPTYLPSNSLFSGLSTIPGHAVSGFQLRAQNSKPDWKSQIQKQLQM
jgi:hypothetical protein